MMQEGPTLVPHMFVNFENAGESSGGDWGWGGTMFTASSAWHRWKGS